MKKRAVIWGTGGTAENFLKRQGLYADYQLVAFLDNDSSKWGEVFGNGLLVVAPDDLKNIGYDTIIICSIYYEKIIEQLQKLDVDFTKIVTYENLEHVFCQKFIDKYQASEDTEIQAILKLFQQGKINVLGAHILEEKLSEVYRDEEDYPYIDFFGKKMYFPKDYLFVKYGNKEYVRNILGEQEDGSPHRYLKDTEQIPHGAIVVDAGVCEGNFALQYIDKVKKIYLIEADSKWMEVLKRTFADYQDKVVFCGKFLSGRDNAYEITLDSLVPDHETVDFIKMDIEGAEVDALLGAKRVLENSAARCAICSYHRQYDEKYISFILNAYGYQTSYSEGYMCFPYDENISDTIDLRHGVVYAKKQEDFE